MLNKLVRGSLIAIYLLTAVSAIIYFGFWIRYAETLLDKTPPEAAVKRLEPPRHIDNTTMRLLGSVYQTKLSSFVHFEQTKPPDTLRICALGDSHTEGDEVDERLDYPSYLQRMFNQHGINNVQVLNFGNSWYGFSQIYVMWKNVAKRFSCDFVLLLPMEFWAQRDTTFNHTNGRHPDYLHARLVLETDKIRLIAPLGSTAEQRLDEYVRLIPREQYLRYDRHPPNISAALLLNEREIPNPFYYDRRSGLEEVSEIYSKIIRGIAEDGPQVIVLFRGWHRSLYPRLIPAQPDGIGVALSGALQGFPYRTPVGHLSPWGNEVTARFFFQMLTRNSDPDISLATISDRLATKVSAPEALHTYKQVWLTYLGERLGYFIGGKPPGYQMHDLHMEVFTRRGIGALLALVTTGGNIADACLLPLRNVPPDQAELIFVPSGTDGVGLPLGKARQMQPDVAIFQAIVSNSSRDHCRQFAIESGDTKDGLLKLHGETIATIEDYDIQASHGSALLIGQSGEYLASIESVETPGVISIKLRRDDGSVLSRTLMTVQANIRRDFLEIKKSANKAIELVGDTARIVE